MTTAAYVKLINMSKEIEVCANKILRDTAWSYIHTLRVETGECEIIRKSPTTFIIRPYDGVSVQDCAHDAIFALMVARARNLEDFWGNFNWETYLRHMSIFIDFDPKLVPNLFVYKSSKTPFQ